MGTILNCGDPQKLLLIRILACRLHCLCDRLFIGELPDAPALDHLEARILRPGKCLLQSVILHIPRP